MDNEKSFADKFTESVISWFIQEYKNSTALDKRSARYLGYAKTTLLLLFASFGSIIFGTVYCLFALGDLISYFFNAYMQKKRTAQQSAAISPVWVRELLCRILQDNARVLNIIPPEDVSAITPVQYPVESVINGIPYLRFIVKQAENCRISSKELCDLLNVRVSQILQEDYYNCIIRYRDASVITVFDVSPDLYHRNHLCISVMVVDDENKYQFLLHQKRSEQISDSAASDYSDDDF